MKSLIVLTFIIFTSLSFCQNIGDTNTPYDTTGWDQPEEFTLHYGFPVYRLLSNPGGWINRSQEKVDSLLWELIVYTLQEHLIIENDSLKFSPEISGKGQFTATAEVCTVAVDSMKIGDDVIVTPLTALYNVNDILRIIAIEDGQFIVGRNSTGGTSDLEFTYIWISKK